MNNDFYSHLILICVFVSCIVLFRFLDDFVTSLNGVIGLAQPKEAA